MGTRQKADSPRRLAHLSLDGLWGLTAVALPMGTTLLRKMSAVDLAYHVRLGAEMMSSGSLVRSDTMTFTVPGAPWIDQQWGAQVIFAALHRIGGWATLASARMLLVGLTLLLVHSTCRQRGATARTAALLTLGSFLISLPALAMRPQLLAVVLFALTLRIVMRRREAPGQLWLLPLVTAIWANIHGSFFLVPLALSLAGAEDALARRWKDLRGLVVVGATSLLATLLTPFGPSVWTYVWDLVTNPVVRSNIVEWAPLTLSGYAGWAFFMSALGLAGFLAYRPERTPAGDLLWIATFFLLALPAVRGALWWGLVAPVVLAGLLPRSQPRELERETGAVNSGMAVLLVGAVILLLPWWRGGDDAEQARQLLSEAPVETTEAMKTALPPGARIFAAQPLASWLEFALPDRPEFVDPRIELFPAEVWDDYSEIRFEGADWRETLDRWEVDAVVVDVRSWTLGERLETDRGWTLIFEDESAAVFVRTLAFTRVSRP